MWSARAAASVSLRTEMKAVGASLFTNTTQNLAADTGGSIFRRVEFDRFQVVQPLVQPDSLITFRDAFNCSTPNESFGSIQGFTLRVWKISTIINVSLAGHVIRRTLQTRTYLFE